MTRPASSRRKDRITKDRFADYAPATAFISPSSGARKLALYVEREIERSLSRTPVALPVLPDQEPRVGKDKPRAPARPEAGPVVPLTGANVGRREELLDGGREQPAVGDSVANRLRSMGEGVPTGRADDFRWPRGATNPEPNAPSAAAKK